MNEYALTLDLAKAKERQQQTIFLRQGDKNATTIVATITDHGVAASTSGMTARFAMRLPNGTEYYRKAATLNGNVATVTIDEAQAASVVGRTDVAYFQLLQGSTVVASTESFTVIVLPDALADATVPESYDSAIQDAIDALDDAVEQLPATVEDVLAAHPEWTTTVTDGSVSDAKLYQGTDGILARVGRLQYRLANLLANALPEGETATATDAARTPMAGLALYGRSTQDGTPTPSAPVPIVSVGAANVIDEVKVGLSVNSNTNKISTSNGAQTAVAHVSRNTDYTLAYDGGNRCIVAGVDSPNIASGDTVRTLFSSSSRVSPKTFNTGENDYVAMFVATSAAPASSIQLNAGSTAYPFVPYGHAGLWAKRTSDASVQTVTPIPLDGHELRSLPDGTRDELTVDSRGHAVLVRRTGSVRADTLASAGKTITEFADVVRISYTNVLRDEPSRAYNGDPAGSGWCNVAPYVNNYTQNSVHAYAHNGYAYVFVPKADKSTWNATTATEWTNEHAPELVYALATPVTHDLGTIDPVPLVGPDLTAQAVPTAPFALTYERDLNATLARLESAIANLV